MNPLLNIEGLTVQFGGLTAVDSASLTIAPGEIRGLIGPNGAGKTTLFNAISGLAPASAGTIHLDGLDITSKSAPHRAALGIRRTFQTVQLVQSFTVYENLLFGQHTAARDPFTAFVVGAHASRVAPADAEAVILRVLDYLQMNDLRESIVGTLTIAQQRYVEIGRALVGNPKLLMLDEPTAGLSPGQVERLDDLIARLPADWNVAILLVEHVIPLVVKLCNRITVLDRGCVIADGTGAEIENNAAVQKAYLGERLDA